jgi:hypothetical protein
VIREMRNTDDKEKAEYKEKKQRSEVSPSSWEVGQLERRRLRRGLVRFDVLAGALGGRARRGALRRVGAASPTRSCHDPKERDQNDPERCGRSSGRTTPKKLTHR